MSLTKYTYWQKLEDNKVLNSKPLPLAKPVNMSSGITPEIFGDITMIADFVYTFRGLLVPRESLHISVGKQCNESATKPSITGV